MERGRLLHMLYSARNESWVSGEDGFKHPDFPWTFRGTQPQTLPPPGIMNDVGGNITHISDWNTAADEYGMLMNDNYLFFTITFYYLLRFRFKFFLDFLRYNTLCVILDCGYPTVNGDAEPETPVMINGGNFVPGPPPPVYQMVPNAPVYMGNVPPPVHGYVPSQMSPYQQPMYPGPEPPMDPNHRRPNISRNPKGIPPPPNVKRSNDMAYRHPENMEMANYQTQPTYIAVPPPHYYYSPQNSPLYLPSHHGHPTYPMYTHPHPTIYNPYPQPGPPMYHSPPAGQVPQQPLLVESCKPNINQIPSVHNVYPQVPENIINETPLEPEIMSLQPDTEVELQVQSEHVKVDILEIQPEESHNEIMVTIKETPIVTEKEMPIVTVKEMPIVNVKEEVPIIVETIIPVESDEKIKKSSSTKTKKKKAPLIVADRPEVEEESENEESVLVMGVQEEAPLNQEQACPPVSIPSVAPEIQEPVKPVAKTWAGLFSGCSNTSNDKVFTLHGSSQPVTNPNAEPIVMPSRSIPDNTIRSSVFVANNNQKQNLAAKPRPSSSNSISSGDDSTLYLQRLGGKFFFLCKVDN